MIMTLQRIFRPAPAGASCEDSATRLALCSAHASHVGRRRSSNQDVVLHRPDLATWSVFDGMGGTSAGDVAARIACQATADTLEATVDLPGPSRLRGALAHAAARVYQEAQNHWAWRGMGTTAVLCHVEPSGVFHVAHIGDSRAYLLHGQTWIALTRDHSVLQDLIDQGRIHQDAARRHPMQNVLSRSLGHHPEVSPDIASRAMAIGDRILLCSDGLTSYASDAEICRVLMRRRDPQIAVDALIKLALHGGGGDNVSVVVIDRVA